MRKEVVIIFSILSILVLSGCDVYNTLYVKQPTIDEGTEVVNEEDIVSEEDLDELDSDMEEVEASEEADDAVEEEITLDIPEEDEDLASVGDISSGIDEGSDVSEADEEPVSEDATVVIVEETETVSLKPQAEDPDNDVLTFTYTNPLDVNGRWDTTYGDAGEYTVTVTASDGTLTASKQALIIIKRKEEAPVIDLASPDDESLEIRETEELEFAVIASDLNNDELTYSWKLDGEEVSDSDSFTYETSYEDSGSHTVKVSVSDGISEAEELWSLTVENVNRLPVVEEIDDIEARETDTIVIELEAFDEDGDVLAFTVNDQRFDQDENVFTWETTYDDEGEHIITVLTTDGTDETSQDIVITIENVNRPPVILDIVQEE